MEDGERVDDWRPLPVSESQFPRRIPAEELRLARARQRQERMDRRAAAAYVNAVGPDGQKTKTKVRYKKKDLPTRPKKRLVEYAQNRVVKKRKPEEEEEVSPMK